MNNQEKDHCLGRLIELDRKITDQVNFLFDHDSEIITEQKENISNKAKLIFNKVGDLLEKHGVVESYKVRKESKIYPQKIDYRALNFKSGSASIRFFEEADRNETEIRIQEFKNWHTAVVYLKKDDIIIKYGIEDFNQVSETGGNKINHLVDLIEEEKLSEKV